MKCNCVVSQAYDGLSAVAMHLSGCACSASTSNAGSGTVTRTSRAPSSAVPPSARPSTGASPSKAAHSSSVASLSICASSLQAPSGTLGTVVTDSAPKSPEPSEPSAPSASSSASAPSAASSASGAVTSKEICCVCRLISSSTDEGSGAEKVATMVRAPWGGRWPTFGANVTAACSGHSNRTHERRTFLSVNSVVSVVGPSPSARFPNFRASSSSSGRSSIDTSVSNVAPVKEIEEAS